MTDAEARTFLHDMWDRLIRQTPNRETLDHYITDDFVADSDGRPMDRSQFEGHLQLLRDKLRSFEVEIKAVVPSETCIAAVIIVRMATKDGARSQIQANAFYFLKDGRISGLNELTRLISGREEDRGLVARSS